MKKRFDPVIILLALFSILMHLLVMNNLEYHRDELLYFSLGQHPAFGYATVPPMIGWIAWLMQHLFGYSIFAVRIFPAIMSGIMVILIAAIAQELGGSRYSSILAATGFIVSIVGLRTFTLFQPVHIDLFFWTLSFYLIVKYINTSSDKYLLIFGIMAGCALLNKYLIGLLFLFILVIIPFTGLRTVLKNRKFWSGMAAGAIIFLPNFIWQILHGIPLIRHLSELERTQLVNVDRAKFLMEQVMIPGAASFLTIGGLLFLFVNKNVRKYRFLGIAAVLVIISLMLLRGKSYYTQGIFPFLISAGAVSFEKILKTKWLKVAFVVFLILFTIPVVPIGMPVLKAEGLISYFNTLETKYHLDIGRRWEDNSIHPLPQDYADMLGWVELASVTNKAYQMVADKKSCFIYCENYGQAGAIAIIGEKYNLPEPVCFSESFRYWIPIRFNPDPNSLIYINNNLPGEDVHKLFRKVTKIGSVSYPFAREYGTGVYLFQDTVFSFNKFWKDRISRLQK